MSGVKKGSGIELIDPAWISQGSDYATALAWSPDGARLAAASADGAIRLLDAATGDILLDWPGHGMGTLALAWSPDGRRLASGGQDGQARLWEAATGLETAALNGGGAWVEHLAFSRKDHRLATAAGRILRLWNAGGECMQTFEPHTSTITGLRWLRAGRQLATTCYGGVSLWRVGQSFPQQRFEWKGSILTLALSPDNKQLAGGCQDASMRVWHVKTGETLAMSGYPGKVALLNWDSGSRFLASGAANRVVLWDFSGGGPAGKVPLVLDRHVDRLVDLRFHPQASILATAGNEGMLIIWSIPNAGITHMALLKQPLSVLAWHPNGQALAAGLSNGGVAVFRFLVTR